MFPDRQARNILTHSATYRLGAILTGRDAVRKLEALVDLLPVKRVG